MKRAFAAASLAFLAAQALAQQAPETAGPDVGRNYNGQPFVYDLVGRLKTQSVRILDPKEQERVKPCEAEMMRELRRSGLAENGKAVYRFCVGKLGVPDAAPAAPGIQPAQ